MDAQSSTFIEQVSPAQPAEQLHANAPRATAGIVEFDESVQPPPFWHGDKEHSSKSVQLGPYQLLVHTHSYAYMHSHKHMNMHTTNS